MFFKNCRWCYVIREYVGESSMISCDFAMVHIHSVMDVMTIELGVLLCAIQEGKRDHILSSYQSPYFPLHNLLASLKINL